MNITSRVSHERLMKIQYWLIAHYIEFMDGVRDATFDDGQNQ